MLWQDIVVSIANLMFTYSLIHQVYHGFKEKKGFLTLTASGLTSLGLFALSIAFFTLSLFFSVIVSTVNATLWLILFVQRLVFEKA